MLINRRTAETAYYNFPRGTIVDSPPPGETADVVVAQPLEGIPDKLPYTWTKVGDKYVRTMGPIGWVIENDLG